MYLHAEVACWKEVKIILLHDRKTRNNLFLLSNIIKVVDYLCSKNGNIPLNQPSQYQEKPLLSITITYLAASLNLLSCHA